MAQNSKIEWTNNSWNPIRARYTDPLTRNTKVGWHCEHDSDGCKFCYSEAMNKRLGTGLPFKPGHRKDIEIFLDEDMLTAPLRWKKPKMIFVCSMTDAFADFVKDEWLDRMSAVMAHAHHHTYQVLTKRADRMRTYLSNSGLEDRLTEIWQSYDDGDRETWSLMLPLSNVWLGVSCEDQENADERIPHLLQTPAAIRFVSAEPLLGPIDFTKMLGGLDWVIVGGESGPKARVHDLQWSRDIIAQCRVAGVACFEKQLGSKPINENAPGCDHFMSLKDRKGGDPSEWPQDLRVRQFPKSLLPSEGAK